MLHTKHMSPSSDPVSAECAFCPWKWVGTRKALDKELDAHYFNNADHPTHEFTVKFL